MDARRAKVVPDGRCKWQEDLLFHRINVPNDVLDGKPLEGQKSMVPILKYWRCAGRSGGSAIFLTFLLVSCALRACSRFGIRSNLDVLSVRRNQISSKGLRRRIVTVQIKQESKLIETLLAKILLLGLLGRSWSLLRWARHHHSILLGRTFRTFLL